MRVLILSDIHANLAALEAVLEDARGSYDYDLVPGRYRRAMVRNPTSA